MKGNNLLNVITIIYLARFIMPILSVYVPVWITLLMAAYIFIQMITYKSVQTRTKKLFPIFILAFILYLVPRLSISGLSLLPLYEFINALILPSIIAIFYIASGDDKSTTFLKKMVLATIIITCFTTIFGNQLMPNASRMMATGMGDNPELLNTYYRYNIGGFDFIYTIVLLIPYVVYCIKTRRILERFFYCFFLVSIFVTIFVTSYTTALMCSILGFCAFFMPVGVKASRVIGYIAMALLFVIVFRSILPYVLDDLANAINKEETSLRMHELSNVISGNMMEEGSDIEMRHQAYYKDWRNFLSNPIFGVFKLGGGHSFLLGILSFYGIIGAILTMMLLNQFLEKFFKVFLCDNIYGILFYTFVIYLILLALNPRCYFMIPSFFVPFLAYEDRIYHLRKG